MYYIIIFFGAENIFGEGYYDDIGSGFLPGLRKQKSRFPQFSLITKPI